MQKALKGIFEWYKHHIVSCKGMFSKGFISSRKYLENVWYRHVWFMETSMNYEMNLIPKNLLECKNSPSTEKLEKIVVF